jgi:pSer/pThr/pTyr-binding forkhead associated (FHA) protein
MRIEVLVDGEDPKIYPLDRPKIVVGSHESCDISINHTSISRKHLVIVVKEEKFFVADQGSMNGSYINEHRLVPGSSTEFTSFFPVRLGDNVLVTLLSDEDAQELGPDSNYNTQVDFGSPVRDESTKMISLKDLHKSNTQDLVKKRTDTITKKRTNPKKVVPEKKKPKNSNALTIAIVLILGGASYYQFFMRESGPEIINGEAKVEVVVEAPVIDNSPIKRVGEGEYPTAEMIFTNFRNSKCTTDIEKYLCSTLPLIYQGKGGTILLDKFVVVVVDSSKYINEAQLYLKTPLAIEAGGTKSEIDSYNLDLGMMMLMLWTYEQIPLDVKTLEGLKDLNITIAFLDFGEPGRLISAANFLPESFLRLRQKILEKHFTDAKKNGASEFAYAHEYLRFL